MSSPDPFDFDDLLLRLREGDEDAAREVYDRWAARLIGLARARLGTRMAARESPEDVIQSTFRSFFRRHRDGAFRADTWDDIWAILATIARAKCLNRLAHHRSGRRDHRVEEPWAGRDPCSAGPDHGEAAELAELVERLLAGLDPDDRAIVELSLASHTTAEIVVRLGRRERSVQRVRQRVREVLLDRLAEASDAARGG